MKTKMRKLTGVVLLAAATLATGQSQQTTRQLTPTEEAQLRKMLAAEQRDLASHELHVNDIRAQQPQEALLASAPCLSAKESPEHHIIKRSAIDPKTLVANLGALMQKSDEVILVGVSTASVSVFSPSGESVAGYFDVKVIRSWKGPHNVGDVLTFALPAGAVDCGETEAHKSIYFSTMAGTTEWKNNYYPGPYVLFLRQAQGKEKQMVQGLFPAAGEGLQGMFPVVVPVKDEAASRCNGALPGSLEWCDSYLETSQYPVAVPYVPDPLTKKYDGIPIADFLNEVRVVAADQGLEEKRP
jgi:hypothetical protein